jgi:hypothetical protein
LLYTVFISSFIYNIYTKSLHLPASTKYST